MTSAVFNQWAARDFDRAVSRAQWCDWLSWLVKKDNNLISFAEIRLTLPPSSQRDLGFQFVPLAGCRRSHLRTSETGFLVVYRGGFGAKQSLFWLKNPVSRLFRQAARLPT